jgi:hypothetical protein
MNRSEISALFSSAMDVWNRAIRENRDRFPFREVLPKCEMALRGRLLGVRVHEGNLRRPVGQFAVRFRDGLIHLAAEADQNADVVWEVSRDRLQEVIEDPEHYVDHPAKLDWDFLTKPLGVSV